MALGRMNKRGFIRIMEVMIAITMLSLAVLYVYANKIPPQITLDEYIYNYQKQILSDISINQTLRTYVINEDEDALKEGIFIPENLDFMVRICDLGTSATPCNMPGDQKAELTNNGVLEVYAYETIISTNITNYDPKKVRIFIWEPLDRR